MTSHLQSIHVVVNSVKSEPYVSKKAVQLTLLRWTQCGEESCLVVEVGDERSVEESASRLGDRDGLRASVARIA